MSSILTGLVSFMVETTPTLGSIETTTQTKRTFAQDSLAFNIRDETFCSLFPETAAYIREQLNPKKEDEKEGEEKKESNGSDDETSSLSP